MTLADIITAVTGFADAYAIYITAGLVLGFGVYVVKRLLKAGR